jgi:hypothetical protein
VPSLTTQDEINKAHKSITKLNWRDKILDKIDHSPLAQLLFGQVVGAIAIVPIVLVAAPISIPVYVALGLLTNLATQLIQDFRASPALKSDNRTPISPLDRFKSIIALKDNAEYTNIEYQFHQNKTKADQINESQISDSEKLLQLNSLEDEISKNHKNEKSHFYETLVKVSKKTALLALGSKIPFLPYIVALTAKYVSTATKATKPLFKSLYKSTKNAFKNPEDIHEVTENLSKLKTHLKSNIPATTETIKADLDTINATISKGNHAHQLINDALFKNINTTTTKLTKKITEVVSETLGIGLEDSKTPPNYTTTDASTQAISKTNSILNPTPTTTPQSSIALSADYDKVLELNLKDSSLTHS